MKTYKITVNGTAYDVVVEEVADNGAPTPAQPAAAPKAPAPVKKAAGTGNTKITSPMPGKILAVKVAAGAAVKKGDVIAVLEAMKMENEIPAPKDGVIASIDTSEGASVEAGDVLVTMN